MQHGSADTVVRAMNVKYRKWRLGGVLLLRNPLTNFHKTWHRYSRRPLDPTCKLWLQSVQRGCGCACSKFAVRRLFFSSFSCAWLQTSPLDRPTPLMAQTKRPDAGHIPYMFSINIFKIYLLLSQFFKNFHYGLWGFQSGITRSP